MFVKINESSLDVFSCNYQFCHRNPFKLVRLSKSYLIIVVYYLVMDYTAP